MHLGGKTGSKQKSIAGHCSQTSVCLWRTSLQQRECWHAWGKYPRSFPQDWSHWNKMLDPPTQNKRQWRDDQGDREPENKYRKKQIQEQSQRINHRWDWGSRHSPKSANDGDSNFSGLPCTLVVVLSVLLTSIQEIWMSYLICLLTVAVAHFGGLDIIFLTLIPIDMWSTLLIPQIPKKQMKLFNETLLSRWWT